MDTAKPTPIEKARKRRGLTQYALAKACGITQAHLGKIEKGAIVSPRVDVALAISDALNTDVRQLFSRRAA